jgi:hypothetical protein
MSSIHVFGQKGYAKDSLQIKLYANITYENKQAKEIKVKKVFCDYCNENQLKLIKEEGWRRAYQERNLPENRLIKGLRKLVLNIRISKQDFKNLKDE